LQNSPNDPHRVSSDDAIRLNRALVAHTGEPHLVRDLGLLESACAVPQNLWAYGGETDVAALATALLLAVARNHPFVQGNKRTGFAAAVMFLEWNGWEMPEALDFGPLADTIVAALQSDQAAEDVADQLRAAAKPVA
jgi:death-on-curing protein